MAGVQRVPVPSQAELLHHPGTIVLDQHVGIREQGVQYGEVAGVLQVERDALLAAVDDSA